jgi:hypothetical protein
MMNAFKCLKAAMTEQQKLSIRLEPLMTDMHTTHTPTTENRAAQLTGLPSSFNHRKRVKTQRASGDGD